MDAKTIKQQIAYWEAIEKQSKADIKSATDTLKQVQATIKSLKALLPKDTSSVVQNRDDVPSDYGRDEGMNL